MGLQVSMPRPSGLCSFTHEHNYILIHVGDFGGQQWYRGSAVTRLRGSSASVQGQLDCISTTANYIRPREDCRRPSPLTSLMNFKVPSSFHHPVEPPFVRQPWMQNVEHNLTQGDWRSLNAHSTTSVSSRIPSSHGVEPTYQCVLLH